MDPKWLCWAKQLQSIAQAGLAYSKDKYDIERFQQIRNLSAEILSEYTGISNEKIKDLFCNETGYQTPKVDVRGAIFKDDKILVEGCEIHQFIKKFIPVSLNEIEDRYTTILRDIKTHKMMNKETIKKLEAYNGMFKGKNYGVLNREIKQIGDDLSVRKRKNERLLEEGLLLVKMFGGAKRKNIKLKSKLELLGATQ